MNVHEIFKREGEVVKVITPVLLWCTLNALQLVVTALQSSTAICWTVFVHIIARVQLL